MAIAYTPPGVSVEEFSSPSVSPLLAVPASVCLVGPASGAITRTEPVVLTAMTAATLTGIPADATSSTVLKVMDAINPSVAPAGYVVTTDYTFNTTARTISRVGAGTIPDGSTVYVTYTYTPADYFKPIRLDNMSDIQDRFGPAWDDTGTGVSSALSHAALIAFENGASNVVLQPVYKLVTGTRTVPNATDLAAAATWSDTFTGLRDIEDINVIVPVIGQSVANVGDSNQVAIAQALQDHIKYMKDQEQYIIGIFGEDSSAANTVAQKATLLAHATTLRARYGGEVTQQMAMIAPSKFTRPRPGATGTFYVGGQYVAAALAGMVASRPVSQPLTRKAISGISGVADSRTKAEMNTDAGNGMVVVEQKGGVVQVRHGVTMDTSTVAKRELSVVRAKHRVIESVRDTIDNQVIGVVVADGNAPLLVAQAVIGVLTELQKARDIVGFDNVQARTVSLDPTTIEVRFTYRPAFPVNYVNVVFSLDLTSGAITLPDTNAVNS